MRRHRHPNPSARPMQWDAAANRTLPPPGDTGQVSGKAYDTETVLLFPNNKIQKRDSRGVRRCSSLVRHEPNHVPTASRIPSLATNSTTHDTCWCQRHRKPNSDILLYWENEQRHCHWSWQLTRRFNCVESTYKASSNGVHYHGTSSGWLMGGSTCWGWGGGMIACSATGCRVGSTVLVGVDRVDTVWLVPITVPFGAGGW
jgi:hypothetical protein